MSKKTKSTKKKKVIVICSVVAIALVAIVGIKMFGGTKPAAATYYNDTAKKGSITKIVTGSGTVNPIDMYEITSLVSGEILSDHLTEGQAVKKGDILYKIDASSMENSIAQSKLSLEQAQRGYSEANDTVKDLNITAPVGGTIQALYVKEGDEVVAGSKIADIVDPDSLKVLAYFKSEVAANMYVGQSVQLRADSSDMYFNGKVARISTGTTILQEESNAVAREVEVTFTNPGAISSGQLVTVEANGVTNYGTATISNATTKTITAPANGKIASLDVNTSDKVTSGQKLGKMESTSAKNNLSSQSSSVKNAQLNLNSLYDQLDKYTLTAPIDGTVISKTSKAGDTIDPTNAKNAMAVIADMSALTFTMNVAELDIANLKVGQDVTITADAVEGKVFTGKIDNISIIGTTNNGITTYPVKVVMPYDGSLLPGMNVSASIIVDSRADVITVPISAVLRGNLVAVKNDGSYTQALDAQGNPAVGSLGELPVGYIYVEVLTGISDKAQVEILEGLKEGAEILASVVVPNFDANSSYGGMVMY